MKILAMGLFLALGCGSVAQPDSKVEEPTCDVYCTLAAVRCRAPYSLYDSFAGCINACATFSTDGHTGDTSGNTFQCRMTYVMMSRPNFAYCANASPAGGTACQ